VDERVLSPDFEQFVARHFGARGRDWLDRLPEQVERYLARWRLEFEHFLPGGLMSCCLAVRTEAGQAAVLKLSGPWTSASAEALALRAWNGGPAPMLLRSDEDGDALLLERISPADQFGDGTGPGEIQLLAELLASLHAPALDRGTKAHLPALPAVVEKQIVTAGDEALARSIAEGKELRPRLKRARARAMELLGSSAGRDVLLHGDLESKNILYCQSRGLVAIDPLPCVGDPAYDAGYWLAFALDPKAWERASAQLAKRLDLEPARVRAWASVVALDC
jgi:streptomycin 6-kinase